MTPYYLLDYPYRHSHRHHFDHIGQSDLARHLEFIHDDTARAWDPQGLAALPDLVMRCRRDTGRLPVLCLESNQHDLERISQRLDQCLDPDQYFILGPDPRLDRYDRSNQAPWPSFLMNQQNERNLQIDQPKIYRISYLSGVARYYRILLWHHIRDLATPQDVVVVNRFSEWAYHNTLPGGISLEQANLMLEGLPWTSQPSFLDYQYQSALNVPYPGENDHPAYRAAINITGETLFGQQMLVTEKTWKAYRSRCLVINYHCPGMIAWLRSLGFWISNLDIDTLDTDSKISSVKALFQRDDVFDLWHANRQEINHNFDLVSNIGLSQRLCQDAVARLETLL